MTTERFDELTAPPIKGRFYRVWHVKGDWDYTGPKWWPLWGARHEDAKWIGFELLHWHVNRFFVAEKHQLRAATVPISRCVTPGTRPELRSRKCLTAKPAPFPMGRALASPKWREMYTHYGGQQCKRGNGWICPHKGFDLGPMKPGADGYIQCPLHGILVKADTGVVASFDGRAHREMPIAKAKANG